MRRRVTTNIHFFLHKHSRNYFPRGRKRKADTIWDHILGFCAASINLVPYWFSSIDLKTVIHYMRILLFTVDPVDLLIDLPVENLHMSVNRFYAACCPPKPHNFDHSQIKSLTHTVKYQYCWPPLHCHWPLVYPIIESQLIKPLERKWNILGSIHAL